MGCWHESGAADAQGPFDLDQCSSLFTERQGFGVGIGQYLCDAGTGAVPQTLEGHSNRVSAVAFSLNDKVLASSHVQDCLQSWLGFGKQG